MAAEASSSSAFSEDDSLLRPLAARGWRFRDAADESIQALLHAPPSPSPEALEADLLDTDLRLFGGKSLPDRAAATATKRLFYLHGPIVLQVVSVRDIYSSRVDASFKNPQPRRLLRFGLTDGISEAVAIEFSPIPFITEEIAPGTKIRLENKIPVNHGILCLGAKNVSIIGGTVQSLYEEWKMNQKFSGLSRPVLRLSQDDGVGPPPFEKLDIEARPNRTFQLQAHPVSEAVPVQNQAAAQKLLQKMAIPEDRHGRGRFKGRSKQEETPVFTLDEWERRKAGSSMSTAERHIQDTSRDEELARQLQEQLDLEDSHAMPVTSEAEHLRMNMFSFNGPEEMGVSDDDEDDDADDNLLTLY
uniref:RecQ mediated genome instability protein 1 OB-fold domain-containing protein n=1 Tax=Aegilops tauschii TaxID=37682 RepID=M8C2G5_AEGTA